MVAAALVVAAASLFAVQPAGAAAPDVQLVPAGAPGATIITVAGQSLVIDQQGRVAGQPNHGSLEGVRLAQPITAGAGTRSGGGYWLVASDGGVFAFGDAPFVGSLGHLVLNQPIVGMAATPTGGGYWMAARDGGIFAFGDATFAGSLGDGSLRSPIVSMATTPSGRGYWLASADGGVFNFGDAGFWGSGADAGRQVEEIIPTPAGDGYWLVSRDGTVQGFGAAASASVNIPAGHMVASAAARGTRLDLVVSPPPIPAPLNRVPGWKVPLFDALAACEANGNWSIRTGNGYFGGLQFTLSSWRAVGGTGLPNQHSRAEQIYRGHLLQELQGWGAWPACARRLGLR
jgi:hypothetical protein